MMTGSWTLLIDHHHSLNISYVTVPLHLWKNLVVGELHPVASCVDTAFFLVLRHFHHLPDTRAAVASMGRAFSIHQEVGFYILRQESALALVCLASRFDCRLYRASPCTKLIGIDLPSERSSRRTIKVFAEGSRRLSTNDPTNEWGGQASQSRW